MTDPNGSPIFIADHMLGSLARWMRLLGYDCRYEKELADDAIIQVAREEKRIILTRDKELAGRGNGFFVSSTSLDDQLSEIRDAFKIRFKEDEMRCSVCNGRLANIDKDDVRGQVPEKSLEKATHFWKCQGCQKIYWDGTHWNGIMDRFKRLKLVEGNQ